MRCVFFRQKAQRLDFALRDGLAVEVRATPTIYEARGEFQLNVDTVRLAGRRRALRAIRAAQGASSRPRAGSRARASAPLPAYPRAIGIVTSPRAAALRDVLTTLAPALAGARAWSSIPAPVQGDGAAAEIARGDRASPTRAPKSTC